MEAALLRAQQVQLSKISWLASAVTLLNGTSVLVIMLVYGSPVIAYGWFSIVLGSSVYLAKMWLDQRGRSPPERVSGRYMRRAEFAALALGILWGSAIFAVDRSNTLAGFFVFAVVIGMATGFCAIVASSPRLSFRFSLPCLMIAAAYFIIQGGLIGLSTGTLLFVLMLALVLGGVETRAHLVENIKNLSDAKEARRNLHTAIEAIDDSFAVFDADGFLQMANDRYSDRFQTRRIEDIGDDGSIISVDGGTWVRVSLVPLEDGRTVAIHSDVTGLKLREQQLIAARREAEDAHAAKARFMSTMSHELRTPLNIINGFSRIMSTHSRVPVSAKEMREYSDAIHDAGEHLLTVVNDIIEFAQVGTDRYIHDPHAYNVRDLLARAISLSAQFHGVEDVSGIDISVSPKLGELIVDEAAFRRVLISVMSNAIKFGGETVCYAVRAFLSDAGEPVIVVRDFGRGIAKDDLERVFEPFFQCDADRGGEFSGTGLGLTLARELARLHNGELQIASRPGKGTTVSIILPTDAHIAPSQAERLDFDFSRVGAA